MRSSSLTAAVLFAVLVFSSSLAFANFSRAMEIYESGRFEEAREAFEILAAIGDREALFNLGVMYYRGEAVDADAITAYALMSLAIDGADGDVLRSTVNKVLASFSDENKVLSQERVEQLAPIYGIAGVEARVFPVLLDDKDDAVDETFRGNAPASATPNRELGIPIVKVAPVYPRGARRRGATGVTTLEMTVSPRGYVRDIFVYETSDKVFNQSSANAARNSRYEVAPDRLPVGGVQNRFTYEMSPTPDGPNYNSAGVERIDALNELFTQYREGSHPKDAHFFFQLGRNLERVMDLKQQLVSLNFQYRDANQWYLAAATAGDAAAQFALAHNLRIGRGCRQNLEAAKPWVRASAFGGHPEAQFYYAQSLGRQPRSDAVNKSMVDWLRRAADAGYEPAQVLLAWELSASSTPALRDPDRALALLESDLELFFDEVRILETRAAAYALKGDFKKAAKLQKKANKLAERYDWSIPVMIERWEHYTAGRIWEGGYFDSRAVSGNP